MFYFILDGKTVYGPFRGYARAQQEAEGYVGSHDVQIMREVAKGRVVIKRTVRWDEPT